MSFGHPAAWAEVALAVLTASCSLMPSMVHPCADTDRGRRHRWGRGGGSYLSPMPAKLTRKPQISGVLRLLMLCVGEDGTFVTGVAGLRLGSRSGRNMELRMADTSAAVLLRYAPHASWNAAVDTVRAELEAAGHRPLWDAGWTAESPDVFSAASQAWSSRIGSRFCGPRRPLICRTGHRRGGSGLVPAPSAVGRESAVPVAPAGESPQTPIVPCALPGRVGMVDPGRSARSSCRWVRISQVTFVCSSALEHTARKCGKSAVNLCARGDLNPHVRGHQNLNLARLPISPLALGGTTVQTLPVRRRIAKTRVGVLYSPVTPPGIITIR